MLEITKHFIDLITNNNSIKTLLGGDNTDSRIYSWNPPFDVVYTTVKPAAIFYKDSSNGRPEKFSYPQQIPDESYYFQVISFDKTKREQIIEIIENLLDYYTFNTEHFSVKTIQLRSKIEVDFEGGPTKVLYGKTLVYDLTNVFRKLSLSTSPSVSVSISPSISFSISPSVSESISASTSPSE